MEQIKVKGKSLGYVSTARRGFAALTVVFHTQLYTGLSAVHFVEVHHAQKDPRQHYPKQEDCDDHYHDLSIHDGR